MTETRWRCPYCGISYLHARLIAVHLEQFHPAQVRLMAKGLDMNQPPVPDAA